MAARPRNKITQNAGLHDEDAKRVRAIAAALGTLVDGAPPALAQVLPEMTQLLHAERAIALGIDRGEQLALGFVYGDRIPVEPFRSGVDRLMQARPDWTGWNPDRPEPEQRNRALSVVAYFGREWISQLPIYREVLTPNGLGNRDQLRTLLCEGRSVLAWVGVLRADPFTPDEVATLQALIPALRRRLLWERQLDDTALHHAALAACLEEIPSAAYFVRANYTVQYANTLGRRALDRDRASVIAGIRASIEGCAPFYQTTRLRAEGVPEHHLAVLRAVPTDAESRIAAAVMRWRLTPRQTEVLRWLAHGAATKTIASELDCSTRTVELHITALLDKSACDSRAELVARLWALV